MKKTNIILTICFAILSLVFTSCDNFNGEQEIPAYINIKGFELVANPDANFNTIQDEAFLTNDITEVAVMITSKGRQENMGVYTLKKNGDLEIPFLYKGKCVVTLEPVVRLNGMNATRAYYLFYTSAIDTLDLKEGETTTINVKPISYTANTHISKKIMFEDTFNPFENAAITDSALECRLHIINSKDSVAYGNKCGAFYSSSSKDNFKVITKDSIVGTGNKTMILELDYNANISFEVGIYGQLSDASQPMYISSVRMSANNKSQLAPYDKQNWQKMYITLGKVWANINYKSFKLWFMPVNSFNNPKGYVHIDNIKLVTLHQ